MDDQQQLRNNYYSHFSSLTSRTHEKYYRFQNFQSKTGRKSEIKGIFDTPQVFDETHQNCRRYGFTLSLTIVLQ